MGIITAIAMCNGIYRGYQNDILHTCTCDRMWSIDISTVSACDSRKVALGKSVAQDARECVHRHLLTAHNGDSEACSCLVYELLLQGACMNIAQIGTAQ